LTEKFALMVVKSLWSLLSPLKNLLPTGSGVCAVNIKPLVDQVVHKIKKKVADDRQLAAARGVPSPSLFGEESALARTA
jgi:hypothetical protein